MRLELGPYSLFRDHDWYCRYDGGVPHVYRTLEEALESVHRTLSWESHSNTDEENIIMEAISDVLNDRRS